MTLVYLIKDWDWPDLMRQTPDHRGIWNEIEFTVEPVQKCDYVIALTYVPKEAIVQCSPQHAWALMQEPPVPEYRWLRRGFNNFYKVYTQDTSLQGDRYVYSQPALPWHVNKNYDELKTCSIPDKPKLLTWITSNNKELKGHKQRLEFLQKIRNSIDFDLWGRGFKPIDDKWEGLAPYRYSLAIENHSGPFYWSEKLADCFLSWTMPIYYGCTNLSDYFPKESFINIDIKSPDAIQIIKEVISSELWIRNRDAIAYARSLVLEKYQIFPFVSELIQQFESNSSINQNELNTQTVYLPPLSRPKPFRQVAKQWVLGLRKEFF